MMPWFPALWLESLCSLEDIHSMYLLGYKNTIWRFLGTTIPAGLQGPMWTINMVSFFHIFECKGSQDNPTVPNGCRYLSIVAILCHVYLWLLYRVGLRIWANISRASVDIRSSHHCLGRQRFRSIKHWLLLFPTPVVDGKPKPSRSVIDISN
jgi:hypothetical protein